MNHAGAHRRRGSLRGGARLDHGVAGAGDPGACGTPEPCRCRCSTTATWRPSPRPIIRASGSSSAAILISPGERARKREDLLAATEKDLAVIAAAVRRARKPLRGEAAIALKVGAVVNRRKMAKHFDLVIGEASFAFHRKAAAIAAEAALDGIYVVRTSLPKKALDNAATVGAYKSLARVERAFRSLKTVDIHLRPIFHWTAPRVRAHVFLCMLAYHVEHHMHDRLGPMLYDETDHEAAAAMRTSIVAKAERSAAAKRKQATGRTDDGLPVHSFRSLLADLATYCRDPGDHRAQREIPLYPSTPGQPRSRAAPSNSSPSTPTVPSNRHSLSINESEINALQS